jgi:hypothetical protein
VYRLTLHNGLSAALTPAGVRHLLAVAVRRRHEVTRVRGGFVVTLPNGRLTAIVKAGE